MNNPYYIPVKTQVVLLNSSATIPTRNHPTDAGLDLYASSDVFIPLGQTKTVETGISLSVPEGMVGKIEDRSSMGLKGLRTGAGVVDHGYTGPLNIVLHNLTNKEYSDPVLHTKGYQIRRGDRVAQILFYNVVIPEVEVVDQLPTSLRGNRGYGSSGK